MRTSIIIVVLGCTRTRCVAVYLKPKQQLIVVYLTVLGHEIYNVHISDGHSCQSDSGGGIC